MPEQEIIRDYNFIVDMGGEDGRVYFTEVDGLKMKIQPIDYREGGAEPAVRKLAGRVEYGNVSCRWGMTETPKLWDWLMTTVNGEVERRELSVIMIKPDGSEAFRYNLHNAWPCEWNASKFDGMGKGVAIETLVIAHEGLERD